MLLSQCDTGDIKLYYSRYIYITKEIDKTIDFTHPMNAHISLDLISGKAYLKCRIFHNIFFYKERDPSSESLF